MTTSRERLEDLDLAASGLTPGEQRLPGLCRPLVNRPSCGRGAKEPGDSEGRLRPVFDQMPIGCALVGLDGRALETNPAFSAVTGYGSADLAGRNLAELIHPDDRAEDRLRRDALGSGRIPGYREQLRFLHADGRAVWVELTMSLVRDGEGRPLHYLAQVQDSTESRLAQAALMASEERHRSITESASDAIIVFDRRWYITGWNSAAERIFGYRPREVLGRSVIMLVSEETLQARATQAQAIFLGAQPEMLGRTGELVAVRRDGSRFPAEVTVSSWRESDGVFYSAIVRDITDRRLAEEKMSTLAALVDSSPDTIVSTDLDGVVTNWNPGAERLYGYPAAEAVGRRLDDLVMVPGQADHARLLSGQPLGQPVSTDCLRRRGDGVLFDVSVAASPVRRGPTVVGQVEISRDVTEQRRAERRLRDLADTDPLTGLANRRAFLASLRQALEADGTGGALLFLDLDGFKSVNDGHGHQRGDEVLCDVGRVLAGFVPVGGTAGRLAGDEFTLLIPGLLDPERLRRLARRLHAAIEESQPGGLRIVASIGGAVAGPGASPSGLLGLADEAMYEAKHQGLRVSVRPGGLRTGDGAGGTGGEPSPGPGGPGGAARRR